VEGRGVRHEDTSVLMAVDDVQKPDRQQGIGG
jgi:hypothetical protein